MFTNPDLDQTVYVWAVINNALFNHKPEECKADSSSNANGNSSVIGVRLFLSEDLAKEYAEYVCKELDIVKEIRIACFEKELEFLISDGIDDGGYYNPLLVIDYKFDGEKLVKEHVYVRADVKENM